MHGQDAYAQHQMCFHLGPSTKHALKLTASCGNFNVKSQLELNSAIGASELYIYAAPVTFLFSCVVPLQDKTLLPRLLHSTVCLTAMRHF